MGLSRASKNRIEQAARKEEDMILADFGKEVRTRGGSEAIPGKVNPARIYFVNFAQPRPNIGIISIKFLVVTVITAGRRR